MTVAAGIMQRLRQLFDLRGLLAMASGVMLALSFPNAGWAFTVWAALVPLLIALEGASLATALRVGVTCGVSAYAVILYWLNIVFTKYGHLPLSASIPIYLLLVLWLSLFYGLATLTTRLVEEIGIKSVFSLPVAWVAFDLVRGFLFSGFPWAMLGYSQYRILPLIQIADITGVYGITLLIVLANVVLYRVIRAVSGATVPYPAKSAAVLLACLVLTLLYGFQRLNSGEEHPRNTLRVALIQGNIPQDIKWSPAFRDETVAIYERLSRETGKSGVDLVVWPESALPFFFQDEPAQAERLKALARELNAVILFGSPARGFRNGQPVFLNSAFAVSPTGQCLGRCDKLHLVPFGEYVPLGEYFPFINKLVAGIGDFSPGERAIPIDLGRTKVGTLICYEVIFPELARAYVNAGARVLVNMTNDAWFGRSSAPYQHLAITAFRAVETRTPMVRAANTGVTAIIDKNGHIRTMTDIFVEGYRTGEISPGTADSIYLKIGDSPAWFCLALTGGMIAAALLRRRKRNT